MNTEAVADMLVSYRTQQEIIENLNFMIAWNCHNPQLQQILLERRKAIEREQRTVYAMLCDEFVDNLELSEVFHDMYQYVTVDPPPGFG